MSSGGGELPGKEANVLKGHEGAVLAARFNSDGNYCLTGGKDRTIRLWNPHRGIHIKTYKSHVREVRDVHVNTVKFNEYSSVVVSAGYDRSVRAWDCRSHSTEPIQIIDTFSDSVMSCCLTKTEIIAGSVDGTVRTFDIRMGRELSDSLGQPSYKLDCCLTNTDAHITGGSEDGFIYFWDLVDAKVVSSFRAHASVVTSVSYHPNDNCMLRR
ncbi:unnamed protein product [Rhodiola kirilowii]